MENEAKQRDWLSRRSSVQHIVSVIEKIEDLSKDIDPVKLDRLKFALNSRIKLLSKTLPDLKVVENLGDPQGGNVTNIQINVTYE